MTDRLLRRAQLAVALAAVLGFCGSAQAVTLNYKTASAANGKQLVLEFPGNTAANQTIETVSCHIEGTQPPYEVTLVELSQPTFPIHLSYQFVGQTASLNVWMALATNLHYQVRNGAGYEITINWSNKGPIKATCTTTGDPAR